MLRLDVTDAYQIDAAVEAASDVGLVFNNAGVTLAEGIAGSIAAMAAALLSGSAA
jgi:hypothetical protein